MTAYAETADALRDNGYHAIPIKPGSKVPGISSAFGWKTMPSWSVFCDHMPGDAQHQLWMEMDGAGVGVAHSIECCCVDIDTDDEDFIKAVISAVGPSPCQRRGSKGRAAYYRGNPALEDLGARVTWYVDEKPSLDLLLPGSQSLLPPTIHPSGQPYVWLTEDTLEDIPADELTQLPADVVARLDAALASFGATRKKPGRASAVTTVDPATPSDGGGYARSLNDRAVVALDTWFADLHLPKTRQRGLGSWEAIPIWRGSGSGRATDDRNPNLRASPRGIVDFGQDVGYTPINLVMVALSLSDSDAIDWLKNYFPDEDDGPQADVDYDSILNRFEAERLARIKAEREAEEERARRIEAEVQAQQAPASYLAMPSYSGAFRDGEVAARLPLPSKAQFDQMLSPDMDFPIKSLDNLHGLLGDLCRYVDMAVSRRTDLGSLAVALPVIAALTPAYRSPTGLRTNIYTVALADSGTGKTQLRNTVNTLLSSAGVEHIIGHNDFTSSAALIKSLQGIGNNAKISMIDEFGHMLQRLTSGKAATHERDLIRAFTELFSAAGGHYKGKAYATAEALEVENPHYCMFGMATPGQFYSAFGSSGLEDGSFARYVLIPAGESYLQVPDNANEIVIGRRLKALADTQKGFPSDKLVGFSEDAWNSWITLRDQSESFAIYCDKNDIRGGAPIMRRVAEQAMKIAMISAIGSNHEDCFVKMDDFNIGHAIAWYCAAVMIGQSDNIVDNDHEKDKMTVYNFIKDSDGVTKSGLCRRFRGMKPRDRNEILSDLTEAGMIYSASQKVSDNSKVSATTYFAS